MISANTFIHQARSETYTGIPYSQLDCQAFIERVLHDCGYNYDWRGSNHMWRDALSEKHPITDINIIPAGAWLFTIKDDGGEVARGYHDDQGNAAHVGIYLGNGDVRHSTSGSGKTNGVQMDKITSKRWTHYGLAKMITYDVLPDNPGYTLRDIITYLGDIPLREIIEIMREVYR